MNPVVIYTTANCPYCIRAKQLLDRKAVVYNEIRVDLNLELREEMQQRSKQYTVPQIFIGNTHVGGFDQMSILDHNSELDPLLFPDKY